MRFSDIFVNSFQSKIDWSIFSIIEAFLFVILLEFCVKTIDIRVLSVVSDTSGDNENGNNKSENEVDSGTWSLGEIERFENTIFEYVEDEGNQ